MSPISSSSPIFFPLPFYPLAHIRHTGLLSVCRTCYGYSCFKVSELALPSAGYVPPTDHPMAFYSLLVLISNVTTKSSLPTLGHSLTLPWWVFFMAPLTVFSYLDDLFVCFYYLPPSFHPELCGSRVLSIIDIPTLVHIRFSINICCMEAIGTSLRWKNLVWLFWRSDDTDFRESFGNYQTLIMKSSPPHPWSTSSHHPILKCPFHILGSLLCKSLAFLTHNLSPDTFHWQAFSDETQKNLKWDKRFSSLEIGTQPTV